MAAAALLLLTATLVAALLTAAARADNRHRAATCQVCGGPGAVILTDIQPGAGLCAHHAATAARIQALEADTMH